jgi:hypothetical protein
VVRARAWLCDLPVEQVRTDAVQSFVKQETIFVELETQSGVVGLGYAYTIGTGGGAVLDLLRQTLLATVVGQDVHGPERIWTDAFTITRATTTGAITSLALAALDTAVWDARCRALGLGLWQGRPLLSMLTSAGEPDGSPWHRLGDNQRLGLRAPHHRRREGSLVQDHRSEHR